MDTQCVLDTALAANATTLGSAEAAIIFRQQFKSSLKVTVNLLPGQKAQLQKMVSYPLVFLGGKTVTNDHPLLVACRDVARDIFEQEFKVATSSERTLIVGAAAREISKYNANPHIHYYIYGKETKDYDRVVRPALLEISKALKSKANKKNFQVFLPPECHPDVTTMRPVVKRYWKMEEVLKDYVQLKKMPDNIHTEYVEANALVFEDSCYNFGPADYMDVFRRTGAKIAYGYALLPLELIFPDLPENPIYSVTTSKGLSTLIFRSGFCNGFVHDTKKWATLLNHPIITNKTDEFQLVVELTARVGPIATFKIMKTNCNENIARSIELTERERYVRILDVKACVNPRTGKVKHPLQYFSVLETEYMDTYNYVSSLDVKSVTFQNITAYIRRRMGGMSLITKELLEPWFLPSRRVVDLALVIYLEAKLRHDERMLVMQNININSIAEKFLAALKRAGRAVFYPVALLLDWILAGHLVDKLVLFPDGGVFQSGRIRTNPRVGVDVTAGVGLYLDNPYEGDIRSCPVCYDLMGKLGKQEVHCQHIEGDIVDLALTNAQIEDLKAKLIDTDNDPAGLAEVKKRCAKAMPQTGFTRKVKIYYIKAGPGCGKSYLIRQLTTESDLILAPFTKLKADYCNLTNDRGEKYDLLFKTTHRAMESRGNRRIFCDEFTSMPYEYLACIAEVNGAEEVYLVGDDKQTKVQEPAEGLYIGNHIDLDKLSTHELLVNFRNPRDTVALLNKLYGYKMRAFSDVERSIEIHSTADIPKLENSITMCFSKAASKTYTENEKATVRSFQGSTVKNAVLYAVNNDGTLPSIEELQIVALSRHTEKLYIVVDGCEQSKLLTEKLALNPDFYDHMQTWLDFPREDVVCITREDACVSAVIKPIQPPRDMYLMAETFLPTAAFDEISTSMNHLASAMVPETFNSGRFYPDLFVMPINKRGHPTDLTTKYYSVGQGVGNHFSSKSPIQTLQVLQTRYLCKQPFYHFGDKERRLAKTMVDLWFGEHVVPNYQKELFDDAEIQDVVKAFMQHVTQKGYQSQFEAKMPCKGEP